MPDLINPILDFSTTDIPDIPIAIPDSKGADFTLPSELLSAKAQLAQIPADQLTAPLFNDIVNNAAPTEDPEKNKRTFLDKISKDYNPAPLVNDSFNFTNYKSEDSLRYRQNKRLFDQIGYNPLVSTDVLDAQYDSEESTWESFKNVLPKVWATTAFSYKNYFAEYLDTAKAIQNLDSKLLFNDERFGQHADYLKELEELYPDYKTNKPGSGFGQLFTGDFWEESAPSLGFTIGTATAAITENVIASGLALPTGGTSVALSSINTPRKIFKAVSEYYSLKRAYGLLKAVGVGIKAGEVGTALKAGANIWRLTNGALAEASMEGALNKKEYVESFIQDYIQNNGVRPSEALIALAAEAGDKMAKSTILFQTPFLMASNAVQLGNLVAPRAMTQLLERTGLKQGAWKLVNQKTFDIGVQATKKLPTTMFGKVSQKALPFVQGSIWEGAEESYQALVTKSTADYYNQQVFGVDDASLFKSIDAGFDYVTSNDGLKEFLAGFATGSMFTSVKMPIDYFSKIKPTLNKETGKTEYNKSLLNKLGFGMEEYYKEEDRAKFQKAADFYNANDIFKVFGEEGFLNASKDKQTEFMLAKFLEKGDMFSMQHAQNLQLMRMLYSGVSTGKLDLQIQRIVDFANQDFNTLSQFLETRGITDEADKSKWAGNFKAFAQEIKENSKNMERSYASTQKKHEAYTSKINGELQETTRIFNTALLLMREKYKLSGDATFEQIQAAAKAANDQNDLFQLALLNKINTQAAIKYVTSQEMLKMEVFAQMGMNGHAKLASKKISSLNDVEGLNYSNIGDLFDNSSREKKIKQLEGDIETTKISGDTDRVAELQTDLDNLREIDTHVTAKFKDKKDFDTVKLAALIGNYVRNQRGRDNKKEWSTNFESSETTKLLEEYVTIENRFRENLNLFNTLTEQLKGKNPESYKSQRVIEFLNEAIDTRAKHEEEVKKKNPPAPVAPAAPASKPPVPAGSSAAPVVLYDKKDAVLNQKRNPSTLKGLWFPGGQTAKETARLTSTYTTEEVNKEIVGSVVKNTGSKDRILNFESATHMVVFTPQDEVFNFSTKVGTNQFSLGIMQDPSSFTMYRKLGKDWVKIELSSMTLEDFKAIFSTPGSTTEEEISKEFNAFLQNAANLNNLKAQLKAGKAVKDIATVVLSLGNFDFVAQDYGKTLAELVDSLPANVRVLATLSKETNKPLLLYPAPNASDDDLVSAGEFLADVNSDKDNGNKTALSKLGRYSMLVQTPSGLKLIELHANPFDTAEQDQLFEQIKAQSEDTVTNNLKEDGTQIQDSYNNAFQTDVLNKIFIALDNPDLFKKGFEVRLIVSPRGHVRLGLAKKDSKGNLKDLTVNGTDDKLNMIITATELKDIKSLDELLEAFNKKLGNKKLNNGDVNKIKLSRASFKRSIDKDFSYEEALTLKTKLQGTGFKNPIIRLGFTKNAHFTRGAKPAGPSSTPPPPSFDINQYKGKKFNFKKADGTVVQILVQGLGNTGKVRVQYIVGDTTGDWDVSLFLKNLTKDPVTAVATPQPSAGNPPATTGVGKSTPDSMLEAAPTLRGMIESEGFADFIAEAQALPIEDLERLYETVFDELKELEYNSNKLALFPEFNSFLAAVGEKEYKNKKKGVASKTFKQANDLVSTLFSRLPEFTKLAPYNATMANQMKILFSYVEFLKINGVTFTPATAAPASTPASTPAASAPIVTPAPAATEPIVTAPAPAEPTPTAEVVETTAPEVITPASVVTFDPNKLNNPPQNDEEETPPFKIVDSTYSIQDEEDNREFITFMKRVMPDGIFSHKELDKIGERLSNGNVKVGRFLATLKDISEGIKGSIETVGNDFKYHEAFHGIYRLLLTTQEQSVLQAKALEQIYKNLAKQNTSLNDELEKFRNTYPEKYGLLSKDKLKALYVEEWIADRFDDFQTVNVENKSSNPIIKFFQNLLTFIKNVFTKSSNNPMAGDELTKFFKDVDRGVLKNRQVQLNPFTEKLYEEGYGEIEANKIKIRKGENDKGRIVYDYLSDSDTYAAIGTLFTGFIKEVETKSFHNKNQVLETILDDLRDSVRADYDAADEAGKQVLQDLVSLYTATESREALKKEVNKHLEYIGFSQNLASEEEEEMTDDVGDRRTTESFSDSENFGGFKSLSKEVRQYLATVNTPYQLSNGRTATNGGRLLYSQLFLPFIYNGVLKSTAGTTKDVDFLEKLRQFAKYNSNTQVFVIKFFKDIFDTSSIADPDNLDDYTLDNPSLIVNTNLFQLFRNNFKTMSLTYKIIGYDIGKKQAIVINANTKNSAKLQFQKWANGFIYKKNAAKSKEMFQITATKAFTKLETALKNEKITSQQALTSSVELSNQLLLSTGMKFHPLLIRLSLLKNVKGEKTQEDKTLEALYSDVVPMDFRDISNISRTVQHGQNPFLAFFEVSTLETGEEVNLKETGAKSRLMTIAVENAKLDEFVWDSVFVNAEKKKVWTHQSPTYSSTVFKEIQQGEIVPQNSTLYDSEEFESVLPYINLERQGGLTTVSLSLEGEVNENLQVNKNPGTTYGGLDTRSLYITLISSYFDSRVINGITVTPHLTRILEASNTGNMIQLPVIKALESAGQVSEKVLDILEKEFLREVENVTKVMRQLKGKEGADFERVKGYNDGNIELDRNDPKYPRGAKFFAFEEILGKENAIVYEQLISNAIDADSTASPFSTGNMKNLRAQFNEFFFKSNGLVNTLTEDMMAEGLITVNDKGEYASKFLPKDIFGEFSAGNKSKADSLHLVSKPTGAFQENIAQFIINDFVNTMLYNNMIYKYNGELFKDGVDMIKRAKGENAGGPSIYSELINPSLGIHHPTTNFDLIVKPTEEYFSELKGENQDRMDAQSYISEKMFRHIMFSLGRLDKHTAGIYDKIMDGKENVSDVFGKDGLIEYNRQTSVLKLVYFDGLSGTYIKTSSLVLTKKLTSFQNKKGEWVALPHRVKLHELREELDFLESNGEDPDLSKGKLVWVATSSASKMRSVLATNGPFENIVDNEEFTQKDLSTKYLRLQVENPSNKKTGIIDPTQYKNIIDTEQNASQVIAGYRNSKGGPLTVGDIQKQYQDNSRQRLNLNYLLGRNAIFDLTTKSGRSELFHEIDTNIKQGQISPKLEKFKKIAVESLKNSGASSQTIGFFEGNFEMNSPFIREKFENLISAFFTNYGFKEKVPGNAFTLASDVGMKVVKKSSVRYVGDKRIVEWVVIPTNNVAEVMESSPNTFKNIKEYSTPLASSKNRELKAFRKAFEDQIIDGELFIDELQHNVPVYDEAGNISEYYTEVIIPAHHREIEELLRSGEPIPFSVLEMFGVRIPSQDKSSGMTVRVVDFAPAHLGSVLWGAKELIEVSGADFDVDKLYAQMVDMYFKKGKNSQGKTITTVHQFGEALTADAKYDEYVVYHTKNNKILKDHLADVREETPRLTEVSNELKKLARENDLISEEFQKKIQETWERHLEEQLFEEETPAPVNTLEIEMSISNLQAQLESETNVKRVRNIKYAIAEQERLLNESKASHSDEADNSSVSPALVEHNLAIREREKFWNDISAKIKELKAERRTLLAEVQAEAFRRTGLATNAGSLATLNNKYGEQNPGVLNNYLLRLKSLLQSNTHIVENGLDSDPATLSIFNEFKNDPDLADFLSKDVSLNPDSLLGKVKHQKSNKEGASNIAPAVNTLLVYTLFHKYGVRLKAEEAIIIDGISYSDYSANNTSTGNRIFKVISQVITAMTDNAKERIAYKHNLTLDSIPVFVHMVSLGISEKVAQALMLNPGVKEYYAAVRENKLSVKDLAATKSLAKIKEGLLAKYDVDTALGYDYTSEAIIGSLRNNTNEDTHHLLKLLFKLEDQVAPFSDALNIIKLPKGLYNGFSTFRTLEESMEALELRAPKIQQTIFQQQKGFPWEGLQEAFDQHYTGQMVKQTDELAQVSKQLSIPITDIFRKLIHSVYNQVDVKRYNKETFYKNLINDYLSFLSARVYMKNKKDSVIGKMLNSSVLVGPESLGKLVLESRKIYTDIYPGRTSTLLNEYLTVELAKITQMDGVNEVEVDNPNNRAGFDVVKSNTFTNIDENELGLLQNDYENMLNSGNPTLFKTAVAMYAYAIVKDGHMFKSGGLLQILPNNIMKEFMNTLTIVKNIFAMNDEQVADMKKMNRNTKEEFSEKFGMSLFELTQEFSQIYLENFNTRDSVKKVKGLNNESKTIIKEEGSFIVDLFKGVGDRNLSTEEVDAMIALNMRPSQFPPGFFEGEFGSRIKELQDKGFDMYAIEENGKKRWKIAFPYVVKTTYTNRVTGDTSNNYYKLKSINKAQNTNFADFYTDNMLILSDTAEYEMIELDGGYQLSSISGMFGDLPSVIRNKIIGEAHAAPEAANDAWNLKYLNEMSGESITDLTSDDQPMLDQLTQFEQTLLNTPTPEVVVTPVANSTETIALQNVQYPKEIAGVDTNVLVALANLQPSEDILPISYSTEDGKMLNEFGEAADFYGSMVESPMSRNEAQFFKDNSSQMMTFLTLYNEDPRVLTENDVLTARQFADVLLKANATIVDTAQQSLFSNLPEIKTTDENKCN